MLWKRLKNNWIPYLLRALFSFGFSAKIEKKVLQLCCKHAIITFGHFEKKCPVRWLRGQAVKTSPFHGGNTGSIPVGVIF